MSPLFFLTAMLAVTLAASAARVVSRRSTARRLRELAAGRGMQYAGRDLFHIAPRVAARFPIPGISDLQIQDVIYTRASGRHRYLFTVEYTLGVMRSQHRVRRAATFCESDDRREISDCSPLRLAPEGLALPEQYAALCTGDDPSPER